MTSTALAAAVRARRRELRLPMNLRHLGGPSEATVAKIEAGDTRLAPMTKNRLEQALQWPHGQVDRLLQPATLPALTRLLMVAETLHEAGMDDDAQVLIEIHNELDAAAEGEGCFRCGHDPMNDHSPGGCHVDGCGCSSPFGGLT